MIRDEHQEDYVVRQIRAMAALVARILGLRAAGNQTEALAEAEGGIRDLTGADPALVAVIAPATLAEWIQRGASGADARELFHAAVPLFRQYASTLAAAGRAADAARFDMHAAHLEKDPAPRPAPDAARATPQTDPAS